MPKNVGHERWQGLQEVKSTCRRVLVMMRAGGAVQAVAARTIAKKQVRQCW